MQDDEGDKIIVSQWDTTSDTQHLMSLSSLYSLKGDLVITCFGLCSDRGIFSEQFRLLQTLGIRHFHQHVLTTEDALYNYCRAFGTVKFMDELDVFDTSMVFRHSLENMLHATAHMWYLPLTAKDYIEFLSDPVAYRLIAYIQTSGVSKERCIFVPGAAQAEYRLYL